MDTRTTSSFYPIPPAAVNWNPSPLRGRYLRRSLKSKHEATFAAADLYRGVKQLVEPTLEQCAFITGSDRVSVGWAVQREAHRAQILAGVMPLVPPRANPLHLPIGTEIVADCDLYAIAHRVGPERMLAAAVAVENGAIA